MFDPGGDPMQMRRLGNSDVNITPIGFGAWAIGGGGWAFGWGALAKLKAEGKVRWIGVSNFNVDQLRRAQAIAPVTSLQPNYSQLNRKIEAEVLPYCARENIGVIAYSPMGSGLLTGAMTRERLARLPADDWRHRNRNYQELLLTRNLKLVDLLKKIAERHGQKPGAVAVAWVLRN